MSYDPFAPAPPGWYAREGDPPSVIRWWDGDHWTHHVSGALPADPRAVESLVDGHEWDRAPFVPSHSAPAAGGWSAPRRTTGARTPRPRPERKTVLVRAALVGGVLVVGVASVLGPYLTGRQDSDGLRVGDCITLAAPALASSRTSVTWASSECQTAPDGPLSYMITQKFSGDASCGPSRSVQVWMEDEGGRKTGVKDTYCLMENLAEGECVYRDDKSFGFDVACTDPRAAIKVAKRVDQGSGVVCSPDQQSQVYQPPGRTYCLAKP